MNKSEYFEYGGRLDRYSSLSGKSHGDIIDFSVDVNPDGVPEFLRASIFRSLEYVHEYPHPFAQPAIDAAASCHGISPDKIVFGNGSSRLIHILPSALNIKKAVISTPAFSGYEKSCIVHGTECIFVPAAENENFQINLQMLSESAEPGAAIYLANPGNPTGSSLPGSELISIARQRPEVTIIIDEAFTEYAGEIVSVLQYGELPENIVVLRSLSAFYGAAGIRAGYLVSSPEIIQRVKAHLPRWSLNTMAVHMAVAVFNEGEEFRKSSCEINNKRRETLQKMLGEIKNIRTYPSDANYILFRTIDFDDDLFPIMLTRYGIAIRSCSNIRDLEDGTYYRVAVRNDSDNRKLAAALNECLGGKTVHPLLRRKKKPALMIQGTCSNAGKSILAAAFCRILLQDGYRVAPFKAQNMSLNSDVTMDGGEIGRAQAVQAEACRINADPRMNPVLLKPNSDTGCQIIVMGKVVDNMDVRTYFNYKQSVFPKVKEAYDSLANEYDVIVLEGAGSPAEINLKDGDIVNMRMAQYAESPVLLAGDIDRGGVYASFLGTVNTFEKWEKGLLAGFLVNRFRGDMSLLSDAHRYIESFTDRPVLGVIPYLPDPGLPEEDSVSFFQERKKHNRDAVIDIALIALPHISNFTDIEPLEIEPDVSVRTVSSPDDLGFPDIVIIPGSKNVMGDLHFMNKTGIADALIELSKKNVCIVGICGGLQICGHVINDPDGIESNSKTMKGLGLIYLVTTMESGKTLNRLSDVKGPFDLTLKGYEIHHGKTVSGNNVDTFMKRSDSTPLGYSYNNIWTTYLHGIFDNDIFRRKFLDSIRESKGMDVLESGHVSYSIEEALERLAETVRNNVKLDKIYRIMGLI